MTYTRPNYVCAALLSSSTPVAAFSSLHSSYLDVWIHSPPDSTSLTLCSFLPVFLCNPLLSLSTLLLSYPISPPVSLTSYSLLPSFLIHWFYIIFSCIFNILIFLFATLVSYACAIISLSSTFSHMFINIVSSFILCTQLLFPCV